MSMKKCSTGFGCPPTPCTKDLNDPKPVYSAGDCVDTEVDGCPVVSVKMADDHWLHLDKCQQITWGGVDCKGNIINKALTPIATCADLEALATKLANQTGMLSMTPIYSELQDGPGVLIDNETVNFTRDDFGAPADACAVFATVNTTAIMSLNQDAVQQSDDLRTIASLTHNGINYQSGVARDAGQDNSEMPQTENPMVMFTFNDAGNAETVIRMLAAAELGAGGVVSSVETGFDGFTRSKLEVIPQWYTTNC